MSTPQPRRLLDELESLEGLRDPSRSANSKRQFDRLLVRGDAELHPVDRARMDREPLEVQLRDIGRGGAGFLSTRKLDAGSTWRLALLNQGFVVGDQECVVRHCRTVGAGLFLVGVQFVISTGLLAALGIDPEAAVSHSHTPDAPDADDDDAAFLPPADVA